MLFQGRNSHLSTNIFFQGKVKATLRKKRGFDIGTLLAEWNNTVPLGVFNKSDLNRDGIVNGEDLGLMLNAWGKCNEDG